VRYHRGQQPITAANSGCCSLMKSAADVEVKLVFETRQRSVTQLSIEYYFLKLIKLKGGSEGVLLYFKVPCCHSMRGHLSAENGAILNLPISAPRKSPRSPSSSQRWATAASTPSAPCLSVIYAWDSWKLLSFARTPPSMPAPCRPRS